MPKPRFTEQFVVTIVSDKPIPDLVDIVAGRMWSLDHVTEATATKVQIAPPAEQPVNDSLMPKPDLSALARDFTIRLTEEQIKRAVESFENDAPLVLDANLAKPKVDLVMTGFMQTTPVDQKALVKDINDAMRRANKAGVI